MYRIICKYLERNKEKEAVIKVGNNETIHLKGYSAKESELLIQSALKNSDVKKVTISTAKKVGKKVESNGSEQ